MAGAEKTGVSAARADLFEKPFAVVYAHEENEPGRAEKGKIFWNAVGSRCWKLMPEIPRCAGEPIQPCRTSSRATLASHVLHPAQPRHQAALCANGFRDTTRIASGSPEMWRDIALANRKNLGRSLDAFIADLPKFRRLVKKGTQRLLRSF